MNRETFLNELMAGLTQLGPVEQRQVADYYNELIFDGVENGKPEEEIIAGFGAPEEIAAQIRVEYKSQQAVEGAPGQGAVPPRPACLEYPPLIRKVFELVNVAYAPLYGTVELSDDQIRKYAGKFAPLVKPELTCFVMDENDDLVAFGVAAPSIAAALKKHDGRLFPTGWADVLKAFHRNDTIDLLLIAVRPDLQKKGVNAVIISKVMHGCFKIGVKQAETGPMLETNEKVQTQWQDFPLEQHKRRRCFVKVLTPAPQESVAAATAPAGAAE